LNIEAKVEVLAGPTNVKLDLKVADDKIGD
jgi:hypothetical protein